MTSLSRFLLVFFTLASAVVAVPGPPADIVVSNLETTDLDVSLQVPRDFAGAQAFVTDSQTYRLDSVAMKLTNDLAANPTAVVELQLRAHDVAKNKPGAILESWAGVQVAPATTVTATLTSVLNPVLKADTKYWLVARTTSGVLTLIATQDPTHVGPGDLADLIEATAYTSAPKWRRSDTAARFNIAITGRPVPPPLIVSADVGGGSLVRVFDPQTGAQLQSFAAFDAGFSGGVRVAGADFDGDGLTDFAVSAGANGATEVKTFDSGANLVRGMAAFSPAPTVAVFVATGDVNGDGFPDVIVSAGRSNGGHVKVFSGKNGALLRSFFAYSGTADVAVRVAAADLDGDGRADIITGAGPGFQPHVKVFSGKTGAEIFSFFAYAGFTGGVFVGAGDVNGDGFPDIITGTDSGSANGHVKVFSGRDLTELRSFFAFSGFTGGVRVAAGDLDGDGSADIIVGAGPGGGPHVKVFNGQTGAEMQSFFAFDPAFTGGVFVASAPAQVLSTLTVAAAGTGTGKVTAPFLFPITHDGSGSEEQSVDAHLGYRFTLTAKPGPGSVFDGWTDGTGQIVAFDEIATFRMSPNLRLQANFVPDPFANVLGKYDGLVVFEDSRLHSSLRGSFAAEVKKRGGFSVRIVVNGKAVSASGELLGNGRFERVIAVPGIGTMRLILTVNMSPAGQREITGSLVQTPVPGQEARTATILANRQRLATDGPSTYAGAYTALLKRNPSETDAVPTGIGGLSVTVSPTGFAKFSGTLADGTKIVTTAPVAPDGTCPLFCQLYKGNGFIADALKFDPAAADSDLSGSLTWVKPGGVSGAVYPQGFDTTVAARGAMYDQPAGRVFLEPNGAGFLKLKAPAANMKVGSTIAPLPSIETSGAVTLTTNNTFTLPPPDARALKCTIKPGTGALAGSFQELVGGKTLTFKWTGVVVQSKGSTPGEAGGTFIRGDRTGGVSIAP